MLRRRVEKYNAKTGGAAVAGQYAYLNPSINFSLVNFAWQINIGININIDIQIILNPETKAKYGSAVYGTSVYDPVTILGVLTADALTKWLMIHMVKRFLLRNERGYKYTMPESLYYLNAEIPILETVGPEPIWYMRVRKIDATRNFTAFFDIAFFDVNAYPTEPYTDPTLGPMDSEVLLRFSDMLASIFDMAFFDTGIFDRPKLSLLSIDNIFSSSTRHGNISANFFDTAVFDRAPFSDVTMPFKELYVLSPNLVAYMPVFDCANFDYDIFYSTVQFDEDLVYNVMENAKQNEAPAYRELISYTQGERMHSGYATHAAFQVQRQFDLQRIFEKHAVPRTHVIMYHAFASEFAYKRMSDQLVGKETIIQRYIRLGLNETVIRAIAALPSR